LSTLSDAVGDVSFHDISQSSPLLEHKNTDSTASPLGSLLLGQTPERTAAGRNDVFHTDADSSSIDERKYVKSYRLNANGLVPGGAGVAYINTPPPREPVVRDQGSRNDAILGGGAIDQGYCTIVDLQGGKNPGSIRYVGPSDRHERDDGARPKTSNVIATSDLHPSSDPSNDLHRTSSDARADLHTSTVAPHDLQPSSNVPADLRQYAAFNPTPATMNNNGYLGINADMFLAPSFIQASVDHPEPIVATVDSSTIPNGYADLAFVGDNNQQQGTHTTIPGDVVEDDSKKRSKLLIDSNVTDGVALNNPQKGNSVSTNADGVTDNYFKAGPTYDTRASVVQDNHGTAVDQFMDLAPQDSPRESLAVVPLKSTRLSANESGREGSEFTDDGFGDTTSSFGDLANNCIDMDDVIDDSIVDVEIVPLTLKNMSSPPNGSATPAPGPRIDLMIENERKETPPPIHPLPVTDYTNSNGVTTVPNGVVYGAPSKARFDPSPGYVRHGDIFGSETIASIRL